MITSTTPMKMITNGKPPGNHMSQRLRARSVVSAINRGFTTHIFETRFIAVHYRQPGRTCHYKCPKRS
ncbi:hypothetical protein BH09PLA1_BH09PLA1_36780 [soil metagenome]